MQQHIRVVWSILVIGAAVIASYGCGGGGDDPGPPMPDMHVLPVVEGPEELVIEPEVPATLPIATVVEGAEEMEAEALPDPPVTQPDDTATPSMEAPEEVEASPDPPVTQPEEPAAPLMEAPEEVEASPDPPATQPDDTATPSMEAPEEVEALPDPPDSPPLLVHLDPAPVVGFRGRVHVGADVVAAANQLMAAGMHDDTAVSYGRVRDGVGAEEVVAYLRQHAEVGDFKSDPGLVTFPVPPTVRLAEGTAEELVDFVSQAVRLINAALPHDRRIRLSNERATPLEPLDEVPDGDIFVDFVPWRDWNDPHKPPQDTVAALAQWGWGTVFNNDADRWEAKEMRAGRIWVDRDVIHTAWVLDTTTGQWDERVLSRRVEDHETLEKWYPDQAVVAILVHELMHTLGMGAHLDPVSFPNSIMNEDRNDYDGVTGHVLFPLDREALQAAYSVLEPGAQPEQLVDDLGGWEDASLHLRGEIDTPRGGAFGVAVRNGLAQPWADGRMPRTDLADNRRLSGRVSWSGRLLGFTPALQTVGGAADLTVELGSLSGQLDFTGLEHWEASGPPGPLGSGTQWSDGNLQYLLSVRGNTFEQTGGDAGAVTGAFFGEAHEAMGGVLERSDLTAAFGGRQ